VRIAGAVAAAALLAAACSGSKSKSGDEAPVPARAGATTLDLGAGPIRNPLNLYDIGIAGAPDMETAATIDGVKITMRDLEARSVGAFSRIGERLYAAEDAGYRWLVERVALGKLSHAAGKPLIPFLFDEYARLPEPTAADLEAALDGIELAPMDDNERASAMRTLWRLQAWEQRRSELAIEGRAGVELERVRYKISDPSYARGDTVVARLDGKDVTRDDVRALAGYQAELARREYWRIARLQFDEYTTEFLFEREAEHLGVTVDRLLEIAIEKQPAASKSDIDAYLEDNPEYAADPRGRERAADNLRRLREIDAKADLERQLRDAADIEFHLIQPEIGRFPIEVPAPRMHGPPDADRVIVAFHSVGCDTCARGSMLLLALLQRFSDVKLVAGDYFEGNQLGAYRGAIALRCAPDVHRDALLESLATDFGTGQIRDLVQRGDAVGIDPLGFGDCLVNDRPLPVVFENLAMARRLGLERSVVGLFANGVRIGDLKDLEAVSTQVQQAFELPAL
jgi:hypothetical protein